MPTYKMTDDDLELLELETKISNKKTKQESAPGIIVMSGDIEQSDFDNLDWRTQLQEYSDMRNGDEIIAPTLKALKLPIMNADMIIQPGSESEKAKEAADYGYWVFENIQGGFNKFKRHCLLSLEYGLSLFEKIEKRGVKYFNGKKNITTNIISKLSPIQNDTIDQFYYDDNVVFIGIKHERRIPNKGVEFIDINAEKLFWCVNEEEFGNMQGRSILRPIREAWDQKKKIARATATGSVKGSGIPVFEAVGNITDADKANAQIAARTIGSGQNPYFIGQRDKLTMRLESLQNQQNNVPMLEWLNRGIFFNSLTQFMTSGLGQNGSRAATEELKTTYELAAGGIVQWLEERFQVLLDEIIDISYLANIKKEDRPIFTFANITQTDRDKLANQLKILLESSAITRRPGDEEMIRSAFDLPEIKEDVAVSTEQSEELKPTEIQNEEFSNNHIHIELSDDRKRNIELAQKIFQLESANESFITNQEKVEKITDQMINKIFDDVKSQLKENYKKDIEIRFGREFANKLTDIYNNNFKKGQKDFNKELSSIGVKLVNLSVVELASSKRTIRRGIERAIRNMSLAIKSSIESYLDRLSPVALEAQGGLGGVLLKIKTDSFKKRRRELVTETEKGYTDGRAEQIRLNKDNIRSFVYSATLDKAICEVCAPLDGAEFTLQEIFDDGLNLNQPVNPECLGNLSGEDRCRCQWVPIGGNE